MILACWICLAVILVLFGKLYDNKILLGIGAVMVLMMATVSEVSW